METPLQRQQEAEERSLSLFLTTDGMAKTFLPYLDDDVYEDEWHKDIWKVIGKVTRRYDRRLTQREFIARYSRGSTRFKQAASTVQIDTIQRLQKMYSLDTTEATRIEIGQWIARRKMQALGVEAVSAEDIAEVVVKAQVLLMKLGPLMATKSAESILPMGDAEIDEEMAIEDNPIKDVFPTGYPRLDSKMGGGGLHRKEAALVMAIFGGGKSTWLLNVTKHAVQGGRRVLYLTGEGGSRLVKRRFYRCCTGVSSKAEITTADWRSKINAWKGDHPLFDPSKLIITPFTAGKMTTDGIIAQTQAESARWGVIDMIVLDYGDLIGSKTKYEKKYEALDDIYTEYVGIATYLDVVFWTATQANRDGLSAPTLTAKNVSGAVAKFNPVHYGISLNQTAQELSKRKGRVAVLKSREGEHGIQVPFEFEFEKSRMAEDGTLGDIHSLDYDKSSGKTAVTQYNGGVKRRSTGEAYVGTEPTKFGGR